MDSQRDEQTGSAYNSTPANDTNYAAKPPQPQTEYSPKGGIIITENGVAVKEDSLQEAERDVERASYLKKYLTGGRAGVGLGGRVGGRGAHAWSVPCTCFACSCMASACSLHAGYVVAGWSLPCSPRPKTLAPQNQHRRHRPPPPPPSTARSSATAATSGATWCGPSSTASSGATATPKSLGSITSTLPRSSGRPS